MCCLDQWEHVQALLQCQLFQHRMTEEQTVSTTDMMGPNLNSSGLGPPTSGAQREELNYQNGLMPFLHPYLFVDRVIEAQGSSST